MQLRDSLIISGTILAGFIFMGVTISSSIKNMKVTDSSISHNYADDENDSKYIQAYMQTIKVNKDHLESNGYAGKYARAMNSKGINEIQQGLLNYLDEVEIQDGGTIYHAASAELELAKIHFALGEFDLGNRIIQKYHPINN